MAKKKKNRLTSTSAQAESNLTQLPVKGGDGLPNYQRYYTSQHFRWFFELPNSKSERLKDRKNICSTDRSFKIVGDGKVLVGLDISQTISRLLIQHFKINNPKKPGDFNSICEKLFEYLASLEETPSTFQEITFSMCVGFILSTPNEGQAKAAKNFIKTLLSLHPFTKLYNIASISITRQHKTPIQELDFDTFFEEKDYSDRVMMQMLAYCFYDLEIWKARFELMLSITKESLGEYYLETYRMADPLLRELLTTGKDGHEKLFLNYLLECKQIRAGNEFNLDKHQMVRLLKVTQGERYKDVGGDKLYWDYHKYLAKKMWSYYGNATKPELRPYLFFNTQHMPVVLALYMMISTGKNQETIITIKRNYGHKPWYENLDVNLGVDETTPAAQQEIRVIGNKSRGVGGIKKIPIRIPINYPVFEYMELYDAIANNPEREYFFNFGPSIIKSALNAFCASYEIIDDNNELLTTIQTTRLRKTFAGHLLMEMVDDIDSSEDLISKMREALNHQKFDTTLFSYIMKTGMGNQGINTAIVALTTSMLEKAMVFQGTICEDADREPKNKEVYLCDCTDNTRPTHNIAIAERCKKYDMCLGCERSEVYATHLPRITYRIMQYDKIALQNPFTFSGLLEDRRQIALDTINRFRNEHGRGIEVVEHAYYEATKAMKDSIPLLPAIIQFQ